METIWAKAVADGKATLSSAEVVSKVISPDSSNSTFFKNAGLSTRSLKPPSASGQALLEELAAQKQKKSCYHWRICWGQEEEWSSRGIAGEDPTTIWGHEEATGREQSHPSENLAGERCWYLFSALILSLPPVLVGSELFWWCDELSVVLWWTIYLLSVVVWWTIRGCNLCGSLSVISSRIISSVTECSPFGWLGWNSWLG